ncbi:MAG: hypothetical protein WKG03_01490, partial [Telluria sp.]
LEIDSHQKFRNTSDSFVRSGNFDVDHVKNMHRESMIFHAATTHRPPSAMAGSSLIQRTT